MGTILNTILILGLLFHHLSFASNDGFILIGQGSVLQNGLAVRDGYGSSAQQIGSVHRGDKVEILGELNPSSGRVIARDKNNYGARYRHYYYIRYKDQNGDTKFGYAGAAYIRAGEFEDHSSELQPSLIEESSQPYCVDQSQNTPAPLSIDIENVIEAQVNFLRNTPEFSDQEIIYGDNGTRFIQVARGVLNENAWQLNVRPDRELNKRPFHQLIKGDKITLLAQIDDNGNIIHSSDLDFNKKNGSYPVLLVDKKGNKKVGFVGADYIGVTREIQTQFADQNQSAYLDGKVEIIPPAPTTDAQVISEEERLEAESLESLEVVSPPLVSSEDSYEPQAEFVEEEKRPGFFRRTINTIKYGHPNPPEKTIVEPADLPVGERVKINGETFEVVTHIRSTLDDSNIFDDYGRSVGYISSNALIPTPVVVKVNEDGTLFENPAHIKRSIGERHTTKKLQVLTEVSHSESENGDILKANSYQVNTANAIFTKEIIRDPKSVEVTHTVQRGEDLNTIANKYGSSVQAIQDRNSLSNPNRIYPGQSLVIPADKEYKAPQNSGSDAKSMLLIEKAIEGTKVYRTKRWGHGINSKKAKSSNKSVGYCYRYVKVALEAAGFVKDSSFGDGSAKNAGRDLVHLGFKNIMRDKNIKRPQDAPPGSILVYDGGRHGHIEIKRSPAGEHGYVSDYVGSYPVPGRRLIGVYVKP